MLLFQSVELTKCKCVSVGVEVLISLSVRITRQMCECKWRTNQADENVGEARFKVNLPARKHKNGHDVAWNKKLSLMLLNIIQNEKTN